MVCNHDVFFFSPIRCATRFVKCFFSPKKKASNMLDHFKKSFLFANKMVANKIPPHSCAASPVFFGAWRLVSVMVHWWFRFVVWIPGIPGRERDCCGLGYPNSNPKPPVPKPTIRHYLILRNITLFLGCRNFTNQYSGIFPRIPNHQFTHLLRLRREEALQGESASLWPQDMGDGLDNSRIVPWLVSGDGNHGDHFCSVSRASRVINGV